MWKDHISIDFGTGSGEELSFVRAQLPLLLEWDERRSPLHGFAFAFERCGVPPEDGLASLAARALRSFHHSMSTVVLDQALVVFPMLLLGGWQLSAETHRPLIIFAASIYVALLAARLRYLGWLS
jgi:hypothetical protein